MLFCSVYLVGEAFALFSWPSCIKRPSPQTPPVIQRNPGHCKSVFEFSIGKRRWSVKNSRFVADKRVKCGIQGYISHLSQLLGVPRKPYRTIASISKLGLSIALAAPEISRSEVGKISIKLGCSLDYFQIFFHAKGSLWDMFKFIYKGCKYIPLVFQYKFSKSKSDTQTLILKNDIPIWYVVLFFCLLTNYVFNVSNVEGGQIYKLIPVIP